MIREDSGEKANHSILIFIRSAESGGVFGSLYNPQFLGPSRGLINPFRVAAWNRAVVSTAD
jgi:hypothetical protein